MSARFVNLDRPPSLFRPGDRREGLPADPRRHFRLDAVEPIPTGHFRINQRGTGREPHPPWMKPALLIYGYATGRFGSRTIEAATHGDVAVRYYGSFNQHWHIRLCGRADLLVSHKAAQQRRPTMLMCQCCFDSLYVAVRKMRDEQFSGWAYDVPRLRKVWQHAIRVVNSASIIESVQFASKTSLRLRVFA